MMLSIGMIVKDQEKHLDQCLKSLMIILKSIKSELIVVDIGSRNENVEIAKKYTDNIYFKKWNNNFLEIRNEIISHCNGDWFFYIDGNEVIEDAIQIIEFFTNSEYKYYNTASVKIKDYFKNNDSNSKLIILEDYRLFKIDKEINFDGEVKNIECKLPIKKLNCILTHHSYLSNELALKNDEKLLEKTPEIITDIQILFKEEKYGQVILKSKLIKDTSIVKDLFKIIIESYVRENKLNELYDYYEKNIETSNEAIIERFYLMLEKNKKLMNETQKKSVDKNIPVRIVINKNVYKLFLDKENETSLILDNICSEIEELDINNQKSEMGKLLYALLKVKQDISLISETISYNTLMRFSKYCLDTYDDFSDILGQYILKNGKNKEFNYCRINVVFLRILFTLNCISNKMFVEFFDMYIRNGCNLVESVYSEELIENEMILEVKNNEDQFFLYMLKAQEATNNRVLYARYLKKAILSYPLMKTGIEFLLEKLKIECKKEIQALLNLGQVNKVKELINEYEEFMENDAEFYSIKSVIYIVDNEFDKAEISLKSGLKIDKRNFGLLYNLAYLYEKKGDYLNSIIAYKKARKTKYYYYDLKQIDKKINELTEKLNDNEKDIVDINNVLFINLVENYSDLNIIAEVLCEYGIDVDFAYSVKDLVVTPNKACNPYRKTIGITDINDFIEYEKYYDYDDVYTNKKSLELENLFMKKNVKLLNDYLLDMSKESVLEYFIKNKSKNNIEHKYEEYKDITIIVPTYNRPQYLKRILTFLSNYKYLKPQILVLDSSINEIKNTNKVTINELKNKNIMYEEYPNDKNQFIKLHDGTSHVKTKYVAYCPEDDFLSEDGIIESINVLENDNETLSAKGKNFYFFESMDNLYEQDWFEGLEEDDVILRLRSITKGFFSTIIYQVFRTEESKKIYSFIKDNFNKFPKYTIFIEYLLYFIIISTGKIKKINVDLNLRDTGATREWNVENFDYIVRTDQFNDEYIKFCSVIKSYFKVIKEEVNDLDFQIQELFIRFLVNFLKVNPQNIILKDGKFDMDELKKGFKESWVWRE